MRRIQHIVYSGKSIQVIDKSSGRYRVVKTIGSSADKQTIEKLFSEGELWITKQQGLELDFDKHDDLFEHFIDGIKQISIIGPELLQGRIFNDIGFNEVKDELFKKLVLARLCYPGSKLKTTGSVTLRSGSAACRGSLTSTLARRQTPKAAPWT